MLVTDNCKRVKGVWLCFGGGGYVSYIRKGVRSKGRFLIERSVHLLDTGKLGAYSFYPARI
jgi:hypothetical protein